MNIKKLIGTIIGITLFIALIAGATFAWLTFGTTIVSTNVNSAKSMNFLVDYTKGTSIEEIPMVDSNLITPNQATSLVVMMKKHPNSIDGHGAISLTTTSSDGLTTDGVVRWAICRDTTIEEGEQIDNVCGSVSTPEEFNQRALNVGKITEAGTVILLNDAKLANSNENISSSACPDLDESTNDIEEDTISISVQKATTCPSRSVRGGSSTETAVLPTYAGLDNKVIDRLVSTLIPETGVSYFVYFWFDGETINNDHKQKTYSAYIHGSATQLQK